MADLEIHPEFEQLMRSCGLNEGDYSKPVTDKHLAVFSCSDWKKLPAFLGLSTQVVADAEGDQYNFHFLWQQKKGRGATYQKLINALLMTDNRKGAEDLCSELKNFVSTQPQPQQSVPSQQAQSPTAELLPTLRIPSNQQPAILTPPSTLAEPIATSAEPSSGPAPGSYIC